MKLETATAIKNAAEVMGHDLRVDGTYSGRGMFGRTTVAVVGEKATILKASVYAAYEIGLSSGEEGALNIDDFIEDMNWRWDNLGYQDLAY